MKPGLDCRKFVGEKPCEAARAAGADCAECESYAPMGTRILIIKLDAVGDVARTTCLLPGLAKKYDPMFVTWLTAPAAAELLRDNPFIDLVLPFDLASLERLRVERFDLLLSLDKTPRACAVAEQANAGDKRGFGLSPYGTVYPLNEGAAYAYRLGLDDELKFTTNTRTYQDIIFEVAGLRFGSEDYYLPLADELRRFADVFCLRAKVEPGDIIVGLNLGGGAAFANKMWDEGRSRKFVRRLLRQVPSARVFLFGAERESAAMANIAEGFGERAVNTGAGNSLKQFQALLAKCDAVVTGDSLGMHLALAEQRPVVALFGPTCPREIELYGRGEKILTRLQCAPCYRRECGRSPSCMAKISTQTVIDAVKRVLGLSRGDT